MREGYTLEDPEHGRLVDTAVEGRIQPLLKRL